MTWAGDRFLRVAFGNNADGETLSRVHAACRALREAGLPGLRDLTPAYTTLLLTFDGRAITRDTEQSVAAALAGIATSRARVQPEPIEIPVCYGPAHGEDLEELARAHDLTTDEVVSLHSAGDYTVAFIGFTPGFPYLTGLSEKLAAPRLPSPRPRVPAGSIGIAGMQTGVYPGGTPGGWRLIGRTPLRVFDPQREHPALFKMGDRVRFIPITPAEFEAVAAAANKEAR